MGGEDNDFVAMMIALNSHGSEGEKRWEVNGKYFRILGEEEGDADYGGIVRPSQQGVASN